MVPENAPHGQLVATGPVAQWRVGMSLVLYPAKEDITQTMTLAEKGQESTFDSSRPFSVIPTWISGPEPGDNDSVQVMMKYRNAQGESGIIDLTYWTPAAFLGAAVTTEQRTRLAWQFHDMSCQGVP